MNRRLKSFGVIFIWLLLSTVTVSCKNQEEPTNSRTYYESLVLDTPENAVKSFTNAFAADDYVGVYFIFSPHTQRRWSQTLMLYRWEYLFQAEHAHEITEDAYSNLASAEHNPEGWFMFDSHMLVASELSAFLIDLRGQTTIIESRESQTASEDDAVDVIADVEGVDGQVTFRMVQAPSGRWRVYQVILEGGDEETIPWSVPDYGELPER